MGIMGVAGRSVVSFYQGVFEGPAAMPVIAQHVEDHIHREPFDTRLKAFNRWHPVLANLPVFAPGVPPICSASRIALVARDALTYPVRAVSNVTSRATIMSAGRSGVALNRTASFLKQGASRFLRLAA